MFLDNASLSSLSLAWFLSSSWIYAVDFSSTSPLLSGLSAWSDDAPELPAAVLCVGHCVSGGSEFISSLYCAFSLLRYFFSTRLCELRSLRSLGVSLDRCATFLEELEALRSLGLTLWLGPAGIVGEGRAGCNGRLAPGRLGSGARPGLVRFASRVRRARLFGERLAAMVIDGSSVENRGCGWIWVGYIKSPPPVPAPMTGNAAAGPETRPGRVRSPSESPGLSLLVLPTNG